MNNQEKGIKGLGKIGWKEMNKKAYVTYLGTDDYLIGTLCLYSSLKSVKSKYPLLIMCSNKISASVFGVLSKFGLTYLKLEKTIVVGAENKGKYERWNFTFDKLQVFNLTRFEKIVFLDSDMMLVRNVDHLFDSPHMSAVVADAYDQPDCNQLNSGLMVIEPSTMDYQGIMELVMKSSLSRMSACGDQDFIRGYFEDWPQKPKLRLPLGYNLYWTNVRRYDKKKKVRFITSILFMIKNHGNLNQPKY